MHIYTALVSRTIFLSALLTFSINCMHQSDLEQAEKYYQQFKEQQAKLYIQAASLYCKAHTDFQQTEKSPEISEKINQCTSGLKLSNWGLDRYPADIPTSDIQAIERALKSRESYILPPLPLSSISSTESSASNSPLPLTASSSSSSTASPLPTPSASSSKQYLLNLPPKSPNNRNILTRTRSQSTVIRPLLQKTDGSRNLKSAFSEQPERCASSSQSLIVNSSMPAQEPPSAICIKIPSDDELEKCTVPVIANRCFFEGMRLIEFLEKANKKGIKKSSTEKREKAYKKSITLAMAAIQNFLTAHDNDHEQGLLKAKETLKQLGRPEDWRLKILPADNEIRDALFYGIWQQIAMRCRTNDPEFYCTFEEWAFKGPPSKKK